MIQIPYKADKNMNKFYQTIKATVFAGVFSFVVVSASANEILGQWETESGDIAKITLCEESFCIEMTTGKFTGKLLAKLQYEGDAYKGIVYNPAGDNEFASTAALSLDTLELKACPVAFFCKTQKWERLLD